MFRRKKRSEEVMVTNGAYRRWLRAHRPPFVWFMGLGEDDQEGFATLGDSHVLETAQLLQSEGGDASEDMAKSFDAMMREFQKGMERGVETSQANGGGIPTSIENALRERHKATMENVGKSPTQFLGMPVEEENEP